jgi:pimeloyl-ACP methyl ester carboxylesterase
MFAVALALAGAGAVRGDVWEQVHVRVVTIHYTTHNGLHRAAYVVVPDWYGPGNNPPIPLIISPHGRGVSAEENVDRWGDLPSIGSFAVVNPEGQGRRFARFSWGYAGQIDDLARMPRILRATIPWLRIEPRRVYAFGTSMGGQETLLLVARHPKLLAGAAAFDPVTNMASRYRDFSRLRCNRGCLRRWGDPIGFGLRRLAREEIGGTPKSLPRAYARRSPITYARAIARSGVPLQLWWSKRDHVVRSQDQSAALARKLRRLNPAAPLHTFVGSWPHSADMRPYFMLIPALKKFDLLPTRAPSSVRSTQSRPVHPLLPWHHAVRDGNGKLLPWYRPNAGLGYDRVLRLGWNFIERGVPRDPRTRSVAARHLLAAQSGVSQRCVRRLAGLLVSVFGRPAGDRRGARDARLPARTRNFAGRLGVATGSVQHGLRRRANVRALPRRAPPALLRRRRNRQGGAARPRVPAVLRADGRTAVPSRCDRSRERARKTRSPG